MKAKWVCSNQLEINATSMDVTRKSRLFYCLVFYTIGGVQSQRRVKQITRLPVSELLLAPEQTTMGTRRAIYSIPSLKKSLESHTVPLDRMCLVSTPKVPFIIFSFFFSRTGTITPTSINRVDTFEYYSAVSSSGVFHAARKSHSQGTWNNWLEGKISLGKKKRWTFWRISPTRLVLWEDGSGAWDGRGDQRSTRVKQAFKWSIDSTANGVISTRSGNIGGNDTTNWKKIKLWNAFFAGCFRSVSSAPHFGE